MDGKARSKKATKRIKNLWVDNIKLDLRYDEGMNCIDVAQNSDLWG
jgi:hypothetical protein